MVAEIFVDTSAWYALAVRRDPAHDRTATTLRERLHQGSGVVTTNLIVAETHALLVRRTTRDAALAFARRVREAPNFVVHSTRELEAAAVADWLQRYADQDFSFTDAVSFAVMTERAITEALTLDHHFVAAGFQIKP